MQYTENMYQSMIEAIEDYAIFLLDENGIVKSWNKGAQKMIGYAPVEIIGKNFKIFFTAEDIEQGVPDKAIERIKIMGVLSYQGWRVKRGGGKFWGDVAAAALYNTGGNLTGISLIVRDITEKKRQKELRHRNLEALINNTNDLMWSVDRDYKLVMSNQPFDKFVKYLSGKTIEKGSDVLASGFSKEDITRYKQFYDRAFEGETFTEIEYASLPFERWSEISFYPVRKDEEVIGTACYTHNITERVFAEKKITHLNRLYSFVSQINQAIVHAGDEQSLYDEVCRIAVVSGKFKNAWIGSIDAENAKVNLVSQCGLHMEDISLFTDLVFEPSRPLGLVVDSGNYYVCNNMEESADQARWKPYTTARALGSCVIFPIYRNCQVVAAFTLCAAEVGYFNSEEITLLHEAANDISFALDVFEKERLRKLAEERLKYKKFRLNQAQEIAHLGSWELIFSSGVAIWSEEHCRIYGVPVHENRYSYDKWLSFIHPDDLGRVLKISDEGRASLKSFSFYHRIIRPDGTTRYIHSQNHFEFNKEGIPVSLYGTSHDITEIKEAEEKLKHSEQRLKQAQEIARCGSWEYNFSTGTVLWSDEACRIYGLEPSENKQSYSSWLSFIHPDDVKQVMKTTKEAEATLSNSSFYHRIVRRDDTVRHIHSRAHFEFNADGKPIGLFGIAHDITEETDNIERLKTQNEQLKEIAWIQSHKVRGPLATILGLAQLFKNSSRTEDETEEIIQGILISSEKLDMVIHEIVNKTSLSEISNTRFAEIG